MGNSLRCCLACMVPCGALDVVRIVHLSGHVDEFSCPVAAASVLAANPNHTLTTAWSPTGAPGCASKKLVIVSPDSELKRGRIYFLIPSATLPADRRSKKQGGSKKSGGGKRPGRHHHAKKSAGDTAEQDNYLRELLSENERVRAKTIFCIDLKSQYIDYNRQRLWTRLCSERTGRARYVERDPCGSCASCVSCARCARACVARPFGGAAGQAQAKEEART